MSPILKAPEIKRAAAPVAVAADGSFSGYASLFGVEDLGHDVVERGAFVASLARRGVSGVKMLWQHDPAEPIGCWLDIHEDARGLAVRGQVLADLARGREALALMRAGVVDGLSIGFKTVRGRRDAKSGIRRLAEVDLWEISLVTFPMQPDARVAPLAHDATPAVNDRVASTPSNLAMAAERRAAALRNIAAVVRRMGEEARAP